MNFLHESPEGFPKLLFSKEPFEFKEITNNINTSHDLVFRLQIYNLDLTLLTRKILLKIKMMTDLSTE